MDNEQIQYLIVPGWHGSDDDHWQSHWHRTLPAAHRVEQRDWIKPQLNEWTAALNEKIREIDSGPIVLIAHSLGCITVAHWAQNADEAILRKVAGSLLVAPADVERSNGPYELRQFGPVPLDHLPFPSVLVGSTTDTAASAERAILFARAWGSKIAILANAGHINVRSGHTTWEAGFRYLYQLQQLMTQRGTSRSEHDPRSVRAIVPAPAAPVWQTRPYITPHRLQIAL